MASGVSAERSFPTRSEGVSDEVSPLAFQESIKNDKADKAYKRDAFLSPRAGDRSHDLSNDDQERQSTDVDNVDKAKHGIQISEHSLSSCQSFLALKHFSFELAVGNLSGADPQGHATSATSRSNIESCICRFTLASRLAMPTDRDHRYDAVPPIPTYEEAIADAHDPSPHETESQSLLTSRNHGAPSSSRRPNGYRPPTVESDDEDGLFESDDDGGHETAYVRREMQELDIGEPDHGSRTSLWGKRIPFSLSLPRWKWSWRWRLPRLRPTIVLPSGPPTTTTTTTTPSSTQGNESSTENNTSRRWRFPWPRFQGASRKQVILLLVRIFAVFVILSFLYLVFVSDVFSRMARRMGTGFRFDPEDVRSWVQGHVDPASMATTVKHFTSYAHLAGTEGDYSLASDMEHMLTRTGLDTVHVDEYYVYLNYPKKDGRAVQILDKDGKASWTAKLEEHARAEQVAGRQTYAFHGHSKAGDVKGPLVYANYGSRQDFQELKERGIKTEGAIALVRHYGSQTDPALKVRAAELAGFAGCLIYSDPLDEGSDLDDVAPDGRYMPKDGVQRNSVSLTNWVLGDVLTPGWESKDGLPRMKVDQSPGLNHIPSLPLSWGDAQVLLKHLKGHGKKVPDAWKGGVPDVSEWWTGDAGSSSSPVVRLKNEQDEVEKQPIWNVYGKIEGVEQTEKSVIVGNQRDAWGFGATDPHSGTAVMLEVARILGILLGKGWRPLRSIEFMSWDGGAYNLVGSTEFVEANLDALRRNAYAYVNLEAAVAGTHFHAAGSPVFRQTLHRVLDRVHDPVRNESLRHLWEERRGQVETPAAAGDFAAFQDMAGTSSIDLSFRGPPRYPGHSNYDTYDWAKRVGDPSFVYHGLMAEVVALLVLELADRPILPFDLVGYADRLDGWVEDLVAWAKGKVKATAEDAGGEEKFALDQLSIAVHEIKSAAKTYSTWEHAWDSMVISSGGWESASLNSQRLNYNDRMALFETALLDLEKDGGIPNRTQFKHVVFGPREWAGYNTTFPAIRDAIEGGDWDLANKIVLKTASLLRDAARVLIDTEDI
ncbi:hypothetical protein SODALDRAFT_363061 [Sodiomyces alkalinus F11]|uniref:Zn-dependent exopeptidase n=1 Tax=Sodiomyces alkalinus (strain CBS 110278 / VKM F-3762 / F11) TaxID=1314773 RepID=A0A3N2PLF7_SODAK|nr:hypothetical protein SODALDRAFT_363061 [Sodiomyces alkalinus F11]ROT35250.1 hypothetical protein SODALDRAFT_363061 [Sodiomyces alkalinus F11]